VRATRMLRCVVVQSLTSKRLIAGRYRLDRQIGEGGMGVVWAATDERQGTAVALKFLRPIAAGLGTPATPSFDRTALRRFLREARAAMAVHHPNIVKVHEIARAEDGAPFIAMELLDGESLATRLTRAGRLPLAELARVLVQVVSAVGSAHAKGIVHRDLKPDNVFLVRGAPRDCDVRVLDFGIAKLTASEGEAARTAGLTGTGSMIGTPFYMSPEQVFGEKDVDQRSDVWSLGVMMYECLAGQRPIAGDSAGQIFKKITSGKITPLSELLPDLPAELAELSARMLAPERAERLADLRDAHRVLEKFTDVAAANFGQPTIDTSGAAGVEVRDDDPLLVDDVAFARTHAATGARRGWAIAAAVVFVLLAAGIGLITRKPHDAGPPAAIAASPPPPVLVTPSASPKPPASTAVPAAPSPVVTVVPSVTNKKSSPPAASSTKPSTKLLPGGVVEAPPF